MVKYQHESDANPIRVFMPDIGLRISSEEKMAMGEVVILHGDRV